LNYPVISKYAGTIRVETFPSGQRRTVQDPPSRILREAFDELGTHSAVSAAFGVTRRVVRRWLKKYNIEVVSKPEVTLRNKMREQVARVEDQDRIGQWLMDEGSISVCYHRGTNLTQLLVCGSMNDYSVLSRISGILGAPITSSRCPSPTCLPVGAVRVQSARAYALLEVILPRLVGLKAREAQAALAFFPPVGRIAGRHTTDEFLAPVWREYAMNTLLEWNSRRQAKTCQDEIEERARTWIEGRIRRARRFADLPESTHSPGVGQDDSAESLQA
jgi:hypothetical protein